MPPIGRVLMPFGGVDIPDVGNGRADSSGSWGLVATEGTGVAGSQRLMGSLSREATKALPTTTAQEPIKH